MARTIIVGIALVAAINSAVADLPAQESSRRRSTFVPSADGPPPTAIPLPASKEPALLPVPTEATGRPHAIDPSVTPAAGVRGRNAKKPAGTGASGGTSVDLTPPTTTVPTISMPTAAEAAPRSASNSPAYNEPETQTAEPSQASANNANPADASPTEAATTRSVLKRSPTTGESGASPSDSSAASSRRTYNSPAAKRALPRALSGAAGSSGRSAADLNVSSHGPNVRVDIAGPQGIDVGKAAVYSVTLTNEGEVAASDMHVRFALPAHVSVSGHHASSGQAAMQDDATGQTRLVWSLPAVAPRSHETLRLQLVASDSQPFDLNVEWACRPAVAQATIAVKQAQLELSLAGPADMNYGDQKPFTLTVSNPGTGDAEHVTVVVSAGVGRAQHIEVGSLPAGEETKIAVEIAASQAGEMELRAVASGEGALHAETAGKVIVRKAELATTLDGPPIKYAGAEAVYHLTVTNTGNGTAENVAMSAMLPAGAKYLGGIEGAAATASQLKWRLASLPAGAEKTYDIRLQLHGSGTNRLSVQASAPAGLAASCQADTEVEASADLKLVVNDPAGPLPVSEDAVYEVQVLNRGSDVAEQVKIVMQFGDGVEPIAFEGCEAKIVPGQIVCQPLAQLGAGEQVTMKVKARASQGGTHQFRVEVTSDQTQSRLVSEGTTRFFSESGRLGAAASTAKKPTLLPQGGSLQR